MEKTAEGMAYVFGNNVDTDQIYPGKYVEYTEMEDIRKYAMSGSEMPDFAKVFQPGDIIVGGTNFGCGSSREHAVMTLKGVGAGAILAESFARIFYRNAINLGLPAITCTGISNFFRQGYTLRASRRLYDEYTEKWRHQAHDKGTIVKCIVGMPVLSRLFHRKNRAPAA